MAKMKFEKQHKTIFKKKNIFLLLFNINIPFKYKTVLVNNHFHSNNFQRKLVVKGEEIGI